MILHSLTLNFEAEPPNKLPNTDNEFFWIKAKCPVGEVELQLDITKFTAIRLIRTNKLIEGIVVCCNRVDDRKSCSHLFDKECLLDKYFDGKRFV